MLRKFVFLLSLLLILAAPVSSGFAQSGLPVDLPREQVFVADQIFRYDQVDNFNMWVNGPVQPTRHALLMETLWYSDAESGQRLYGAAVSDPEYNADFTEMTVHLRDNIYWSDGVQFTADDLVYTVQTLMDNDKLDASGWHAALVQWVASVEKVDDFTVKFTLTAANPRFHYFFETRWNGVYMMPKHVFETVTEPLETYKFNPPVSLSAYEWVQSDPSGFWDEYQRRDDWQRTSVGITVDKPGPDYILSVFYGDSSKKAIAMSRGDLDVAFDFDYEAFQSVLQSDPTARSWYTDFPWAYPNEIDSRYLALNYEKEPLFANQDVRWALALATDIVDLQTEYIGGVAKVAALGVPATTALSKLYYNADMVDWLNNLTIDTPADPNYHPFDPTVPDQIATWATDQGYNVSGSNADLFGVGWWKYDTDTAAALLERAGFTRDSNDKWLTPDGQPWTLEVMAPNDEPDAFRIANAVQDQWSAFGIDTTANGVERNVWNQRTGIGDYQIAVPWGNWNLSLANGDKWQNIQCLQSQFYVDTGTNRSTTGGCNDLYTQIDGLDALITKMEESDPQSQEAVMINQDFLKMFAQNMYAIPVITFKKFITWDSRYWTGFPTSEDPTAFPEYWFQIGRYAFQGLEPAPAS